MEDVHLGSGLVEGASRLHRHRPGPRADGLRRLARDELGGNDPFEVLIELLEKPVPAPIGLESEPVELVPERGESLGQPTLDFRFENAQAVRGRRIGH